MKIQMRGGLFTTTDSFRPNLIAALERGSDGVILNTEDNSSYNLLFVLAYEDENGEMVAIR